MRNTPGVIAASETTIVPLSGDGWNEFIDIPSASISRKLVYFSAASTKYFQTLQIPMIAGRDFSENDTPVSPLVAIVNEQFARSLSPGADPIGKTFERRRSGGKPNLVYRIVGLVGNTQYRDLHEDSVPIIFVAESQLQDPATDSTILVRSNEVPSAMVASLNDTAAKTSPEIVLNFSVLRTSVLEKLTRERLMGHPVGLLRSSRGRPRRGGHLRNHLLYGRTAEKRNWRPNRTRSREGQHPRHDSG